MKTGTRETGPNDGTECPGWVDVAACTLPTTDRPLRLAEFDDLFRSSLRSVDRESGTRARLLLAGGAGLADRTRRLADAESSCCSFFTFAVRSPEPGLVALDVEVPEMYADVLAGLLVRAGAALGGTT